MMEKLTIQNKEQFVELINIEYLNSLPEKTLLEELYRCSGSRVWAESVVQRKPYKNEGHLRHIVIGSWFHLPPEEWKQAFAHHPKLGDIESLRKKFATTADWSLGEQSGVQSASEEVLEALRKGNEEYEQKFGYIFILCATGLSAEKMLEALNKRLPNKPEMEIIHASNEHLRITLLRMEKLANP